MKDADLEQLNRDKVLLEDISLRQSFEAYTKPRRPVFITSDSALNAFHVLFEDSFREMEFRRISALRQALEAILIKSRNQMADGYNHHPAATLRPGWEHAQLVVGPALRLLGTERTFFDDSVRDEIDRQVEKIRAAEAVELPAWLEPAGADFVSVDYRSFRPAGFYTGSESLQNYFRAVRWLQAIPFRANRDTEFVAIGLLSYATMESYQTDADKFFRNYHKLTGNPDILDLSESPQEFQNFLRSGSNSDSWDVFLADKRRWLAGSITGEWAKLNDTLRLPPQAEEQFARLQFRVLSAVRLPDSLALAGLGEPGHLPNGLVVAALLGSDFARQHLAATVAPDKLAASLRAAEEDWHPPKASHRWNDQPSLYERYLTLLKTLSAAPEPDAPAFLGHEAWKAKSCLTVMAGWAQMRHTFTLQAKETKNYLGLVDTPAGFIEPNPAFFGQLANLVEWAATQFDEARTFYPAGMLEASRLRETADLIEKLGFHLPSATSKNLEQLSFDQWLTYEDVRQEVGSTATDRDDPTDGMSDAEFRAYHLNLITQLRALADAYAAGTRQAPAGYSAYRQRWETLKSVTRRLEALAQKQLRQQPWTPEEATFIRNYGEHLALAMGYFGNSWLTPNDDAARWTTVASDPSTDTLLAVTIGRPRLIHVLYPWQGTEICCTGSVMSYYEYAEKRRLTDTEWQAKLDAPDAPPQPEWIAPYIAR